MAKKIMIITGSPRKNGNTVTVAGWVAEGARSAGAKVELVDAARLNYSVNGCTACMGCQQSDEYKCIIDDEAASVLARMPGQDVVVFASPTYFMGFSAQLKLLMDRMYSLVKFDSEKQCFNHSFHDTGLALIAVAGGDEKSGIKLLEDNMRIIAGFLGMPFRSFLIPLAPQIPEDIAANIALKEKSAIFGKELATVKSLPPIDRNCPPTDQRST